MKQSLIPIFIFAMGVVPSLAEATDLPRGIVYEGYLTDTNDVPVNGTVTLYFELIGETGATICRLMTETHNSVVVTKGQMSVVIGRGTSRSIPGGANVWELYGPNPLNGIDDSNNACSFSPAATNAKRLFRVSVDGSYTGTIELDHAPMAMVADYAVKIGQHDVNSLLRVENSGTPAAATPLTSANFTELMNVIAGTSSQYEQNGHLNGAVVPSLSAGQVLSWNGSGWTGTTPLLSESDPSVQNFAKISLPTCASNEVLKGNGSTLSCISTSSTFTGNDITTGTISGSTNFDSTGYVKGAVLKTNTLSIYKSGNANKVSVVAPTGLSTDYTWTLPSALGNNGQFLTTDISGNLSWVYLSPADLPAQALVAGGNTLGAPVSIGTTDAFALAIKTNGADRIQIAPGGGVSVLSSTSFADNVSFYGQMIGAYFTYGSYGSSLDWNSGNTLVLNSDCPGGNMTLANLISGTQYALVVTGSGSNICNFSSTITGAEAGSVAYRWSNPNGSRSPASHTVYRFRRVGPTIYVDWTTGY